MYNFRDGEETLQEFHHHPFPDHYKHFPIQSHRDLLLPLLPLSLCLLIRNLLNQDGHFNGTYSRLHGRPRFIIYHTIEFDTLK